MKKIIPLLLLISTFAHAQMTVESFTLHATGDKISFLKYLPAGYDKTKKYPILVSLSGDGEKASAGIAALQNSGINKLLINGSISIPFIVVSPQTPYANYDVIGNNNVNLPGVFATEMLDTAIARYNGDPTKTYISGLSMGGPSIPNALAFFPTRWAAGISMASWETDFTDAPLIKGALWDIKMDQDPTAGPPDYNISFIQNCTNSKKAQYTVIQGACHCVWDQVYSDTWEMMSLSPNYTGSTKQSSIYTWLAQFSTGAAAVTPVTQPSTLPTTTPTTTTSTVPTGYNKQVPSKIEAELYDDMNGVWVEACSEGTGDVGFIDAGDDMIYYVHVQKDATYNVTVRYSGASIGQFQLQDGVGNTYATFNLPQTGGWQNWQSVTGTVTLKQGYQTLKINVIKGGFNLDWLDFE